MDERDVACTGDTDNLRQDHPSVALPLPIALPPSYNYIAAFLTLGCRLTCSYCINHINQYNKGGRRHLAGREWVEALNRIDARDIPITLQGGDPGLHKDFCWIINNIKDDLALEMLTSVTYDVEPLIREVSPKRFRRTGPFPAIRISYHADFDDFERFSTRVMRLFDAGFDVGVYVVQVPELSEKVKHAKAFFEERGVIFRFKELLGVHDGKLFGTYRYEGACSGKDLGRPVLCKTTELLIDPLGRVFRCHHDLYNNVGPVGSIVDPRFAIEDIHRPCDKYGLCSPCDVKLKTNRFEQHGHTSVDIQFLDEEKAAGNL